MKQAMLFFSMLSLTGCAYVNSNTEVRTGTNGVAVSWTHARAFTLFDATDNITKFRNSTGGPTNTITQGTYVNGLNETSSTSNVVAIIQAAAAAAGAIPK